MKTEVHFGIPVPVHNHLLLRPYSLHSQAVRIIFVHRGAGLLDCAFLHFCFGKKKRYYKDMHANVLSY